MTLDREEKLTVQISIIHFWPPTIDGQMLDRSGLSKVDSQNLDGWANANGPLLLVNFLLFIFDYQHLMIKSWKNLYHQQLDNILQKKWALKKIVNNFSKFWMLQNITDEFWTYSIAEGGRLIYSALYRPKSIKFDK